MNFVPEIDDNTPPGTCFPNMSSNFKKSHLRKVAEKKQLCDGTIHTSPFGIIDLLNTQKCLKDFFAQRGLFGDYLSLSDVEQNGTESLKAKERDEKINGIIKGIVEKSIADIAKMRQLIALWDAEERSATHAYIDESSYGVVTQQKIKQYLSDFFSERLTSAENPREPNEVLVGESPAPKEEDTSSSITSPIIGKAISMISQVIQPVVDTIDTAARVGKSVARMLSWTDREDRKSKTPDASAQEEEVKVSPRTTKEHQLRPLTASDDVKSRLSPATEDAPDDSSSASSSPAGKIRSGKKDDSCLPQAMFNEALMEELCNLQFDMQSTPRLSPILEETGETTSSRCSSAVLEKMGLYETESAAGSSGRSTSRLEKTNFNEMLVESYKELTPRRSSLKKPKSTADGTDEKSGESSEEDATDANTCIEALPTSRLLHKLDEVSPVPSPARSSPMIERAKIIISQVVNSIDCAGKVTKIAGKSIAKKVSSLWKRRSGRKKGKRGKGKKDEKAEKRGHRLDKKAAALEKEEGEENETEETTTTADMDSISVVSGILDDGSSEAHRCAIEDSKEEEALDVLDDVAVEDFCFMEAVSSGMNAPLTEPKTARSCDPTVCASEEPRTARSGDPTFPASMEPKTARSGEATFSASAMPRSVRSGDPTFSASVELRTSRAGNSTFSASVEFRTTRSSDHAFPASVESRSARSADPELVKSDVFTPAMSCNSSVLPSFPTAVETDEEQASEINLLQSQDDKAEHSIYSIFENIFRVEFSKKLETSLRQGLCEAVRIYVPERSSTESFDSDLAGKTAKLEMDSSSVCRRDSQESTCPSITSLTSNQLLEAGISRKHLTESVLKGVPPEGLDAKKKSLWKRWRMNRTRKILPGLSDGGCCTPRTVSEEMPSDEKPTEPAIKTLLRRVSGIWKKGSKSAAGTEQDELPSAEMS